jgi:hypothetical protein
MELFMKNLDKGSQSPAQNTYMELSKYKAGVFN